MSLTSPPGNESRRLRREIRATLREPPFSASPNALYTVHDHFALKMHILTAIVHRLFIFVSHLFVWEMVPWFRLVAP